MSRILFICTAVIAGVCGCAREVHQPESQSRPADLTAELAKTAMIDLIRSPDPGYLKDFPLERFVKENVVIGQADCTYWGPFSFDMKAKAYSYTRKFGEPPRECRWHFRGSFEFKNGQWLASKPEVESQALGGWR